MQLLLYWGAKSSIVSKTCYSSYHFTKIKVEGKKSYLDSADLVMYTTLCKISNFTHHFSCSCKVLLHTMSDNSEIWPSCIWSYCTSQTAAAILLKFYPNNTGFSQSLEIIDLSWWQVTAVLPSISPFTNIEISSSTINSWSSSLGTDLALYKLHGDCQIR